MPFAQRLPVLAECTLDRSGGNEFAVLIAADGRQIERNQPLRRTHRIKRPVEVVSQINDEINPASADIGKNGLKRPEIAVNVGNRGKAESWHRALKLTQIPMRTWKLTHQVQKFFQHFMNAQQQS